MLFRSKATPIDDGYVVVRKLLSLLDRKRPVLAAFNSSGALV